MVSFLQAIPETLLFSSCVGLLVAVSSLAGVFITNKSNVRRLDRQLRAEKDEKNKELMLSKLEELYVLFSQMVTTVSISYLSQSSVMAGQISSQAASDEELEDLKEHEIDFHRIPMLVDLYFPALQASYREFLDVREATNKIRLSHRRQSISSTNKARDEEALKHFLLAQERFDKESENFTKAIAAQTENILI